MALVKKTTDPRKIPSGTSYSAEGALPTPKLDQELGSARAGAVRDIVPEFANTRQALNTYEKMTNEDGSVDVSLRSAKMPVQAATFFFEPFSDRPEDLDISEFCDFNIFHGTSQPFLMLLEDILRMYEYGFSTFEPVWELREWSPKREKANKRKYTMIKKIAPRPAASVKDIKYDDQGGPLGITQNALDAENKIKEVEIPIEKLVIFTWQRKNGNLMGKSLLRTAHESWFYKRHFYKVDGIQKERHAIGIPHIELPPGFTPADKAAAIELAKNLRTNEIAHVVTPPGWKISFIKVEGQLVNPLESAIHHDSQIMKNVLVQFLNLGLEGTGGGRATSGSHFDMFLKSLKYVSNLICEVFNLYLIPRLVAYNFETSRFPKMQVKNIGEAKDMQMLSSMWANLVAQGVITMDLPTEQHARDQFDIPKKLEPRPVLVDPSTSDPSTNGKTDKSPTVGNNPNAGNGKPGRKKGDVGSNVQSGNVGVSDSTG